MVHMEVQYRVIRGHNRSYDEALRFRAGEQVKVGQRDAHWPSWLWCTVASGAGAWVPEQLLTFVDKMSKVVE
ncbi:hypothetical protein D2Q93_09330 [Alicyclobacillaceae bacterium I2511]|nr:hypothetical protein D2Q93_09330 [Alicyclobacillaceae bacterium I2511]